YGDVRRSTSTAKIEQIRHRVVRRHEQQPISWGASLAARNRGADDRFLSSALVDIPPGQTTKNDGLPHGFWKVSTRHARVRAPQRCSNPSLRIWLVALLLLFVSVMKGQKPMHTNRLAREKSPYLLQHA